MTTGERLKKAIRRKFEGKTQGYVAQRLGVPPTNLSEWLNDHYEPSLESLRQLADGLDCSIASLIGDEKAAS